MRPDTKSRCQPKWLEYNRRVSFPADPKQARASIPFISTPSVQHVYCEVWK